jgi:hypothetical protein
MPCADTAATLIANKINVAAASATKRLLRFMFSPSLAQTAIFYLPTSVTKSYFEFPADASFVFWLGRLEQANNRHAEPPRDES